MTEVKEVNINIPKKAVVINKYADNPTGWMYFLGIIGSAVYFWANVTGFWTGVLAILKAFVWPAFAAYYLLKFLGVQ